MKYLMALCMVLDCAAGPLYCSGGTEEVYGAKICSENIRDSSGRCRAGERAESSPYSWPVM